MDLSRQASVAGQSNDRGDRAGSRTETALPVKLYVLFWLVGAYLRIPVLAVPPLIPLMRRDLALSETIVSLLTTLPVLLFALAAVLGSYLIARLGARRTLVWGLVLLGAGAALRGAYPAVWFIIAATFVMGVGIAIAQPALPTLVGLWCPERVGQATAVYTNGLLVGELLGAALTAPVIVPLAGASWRLAFVAWALPVALIAYATGVMRASASPPQTTVKTAGATWWPDWKSGRTWLVGLTLTASSSPYFCANAFLPDYLRATGHPELLSLALGLLNGSQALASFIVMSLAGRLIGRRLPFFLAALGAFLPLVALGFHPGGGAILALSSLIGFCTSLVFILGLALPPILSSPEQTHLLSAAMFAINYLCAFLTPLLGGLAWDLTGISATAFLPASLIVLASLVAIRAVDLRPYRQYENKSA